MKTLLIRTLFLTLWLCSCQETEIARPSAPTSTDYSAHPHHARYQKYLDDYHTRTQAPGSILLVSRPGEGVWVGTAGYANLEHRTPFGESTPFRVGSITKVFVSTLVLMSVQEGKLRLDDRLATLLPALAAQVPSSDRITVRQLLAHTSGLSDPPNQSLQYQTDIVNNPDRMAALGTEGLLRKYVFGQKLLFEPGSEYAYSNPGYLLLGLILETVEKKPLSALLQEKLAGPLGLTQTYLEPRDNPQVARGYALTTAHKVKDVTRWDQAEGDGRASGGLVSTVQDLHRFYRALFEGKLLSEVLLADMKKQQLAGCRGIDCEYGLGLEIWRLGGQTGYGHNGALVGIEANALYFPESHTVVVLYKNLGGGSDKSFMEELVK